MYLKINKPAVSAGRRHWTKSGNNCRANINCFRGLTFSNQFHNWKKNNSSLDTVALEVHDLEYWEPSGLTVPSFLSCWDMYMENYEVNMCLSIFY